MAYKTQLCRCHIPGQSICCCFFFFLPRFMICECEKLPLGLAPPTIRILPFPPSSDGINVQVWPTLTPGALPLGIKEYLLTTKQFQQGTTFLFLPLFNTKLDHYIKTATNQSALTYHIPSLGLSSGSSTGRNSMAVKDKWMNVVLIFFHTSLDRDQLLTFSVVIGCDNK